MGTNWNLIVAACNQRIQGLEKHVTAKTEILVNGDSKSLAQVTAKFGASSQEAKDMGYAPNRLGKKSVATKNEAVQQSLATRSARHTMASGRRQTQTLGRRWMTSSSCGWWLELSRLRRKPPITECG